MLSIILCRRMLRIGCNEKKYWTKSFMMYSIKSRKQIIYCEGIFSHTSIRNPIYSTFGIRVI